MRRREFIKVVAGSAAAWPLAAYAQKPAKSAVIGVLWPNPPSQFEPIRQRLKELGHVEGKNIRFEFRWAEGALDKLPEMALELVQIPVDLIITLAPPATLAAQRATRTIPIVFVAMGDPLASGVVASLAHPGANLTGTTRMISEMTAKHVEMLKEIYPHFPTWLSFATRTIHRIRRHSGQQKPRLGRCRFKFVRWKCVRWRISTMSWQQSCEIGTTAYCSSRTPSFSYSSGASRTSR